MKAGLRTAHCWKFVDSSPLTAATHLYTCANFAHVRHSPNLRGSTPSTFSPLSWRGKHHSVVGFGVHKDLSRSKNFYPKLELIVENVCFGPIIHIWFRQGKALLSAIERMLETLSLSFKVNFCLRFNNVLLMWSRQETRDVKSAPFINVAWHVAIEMYRTSLAKILRLFSSRKNSQIQMQSISTICWKREMSESRLPPRIPTTTDLSAISGVTRQTTWTSTWATDSRSV